MILAAYLSFFLLISSVGAAKDGDDDWVHLPNKCEAALSYLSSARSALPLVQGVDSQLHHAGLQVEEVVPRLLWSTTPTRTYFEMQRKVYRLHLQSMTVQVESIFCKFVSIEMKSAFDETGKTKEVIDTKYRSIDSKGASPIKYVKSDLRFIEVVENVCQRLLEYNLHKERSGSNRFAKGMSETFSTLHGLVNKGVNVVMDIPYELWNETSAEVADLKKQCDVMIEQYEDVIEDWYKGSQEEDLTTYLCEKHVLKGQDRACLNENWTQKKKGDQAAIAEDKKKKKKKKGGKKGKGKGEEGGEGGGDGSSEGEKASKKKKKVKKKKKSKSPVEKTDGGVSSDEEIQPQVPLSGQKTEL